MKILAAVLVFSLVSTSFSQTNDSDSPTTKDWVISGVVVAGLVAAAYLYTSYITNKEIKGYNEANELKSLANATGNPNEKERLLLEARAKYTSFINGYKNKGPWNFSEKEKAAIKGAEDSLAIINRDMSKIVAARQKIEFEKNVANSLAGYQQRLIQAEEFASKNQWIEAIKEFRIIAAFIDEKKYRGVNSQIDSIYTLSKERERHLFERWKSDNSKEYSKVLKLQEELRDVDSKLISIRKKHDRFRIEGRIIDRDERHIQLIGMALSEDGDFRKYGTLLEDGSIIIQDYSQNNIYATHYSGIHYFLGRKSGRNRLGGITSAYLYGELPENSELKSLESRQALINSELHKLRTQLRMYEIQAY